MNTKRNYTKHKKWCESEEATFEIVYPYVPNKILSQRFGVSIKAIEHQASRQKLKKERKVTIEAISSGRKESYNKTRKDIALSNGCYMRYIPDHKKANKDGRVAEHLLIMEKHLNRPLKDGERVFHKDGNKKNNEISNLFIVNCTYVDLVNTEEIINKRKAGVSIKQLRKDYKLTLRTLYKILNNGDCVKERR